MWRLAILLLLLRLPVASPSPSPHITVTDARTVPQLVYDIAIQEGVRPAFALAVAKRESNFNASIVSTNDDGSHDYGVMQINERWLATLGVTNALDPADNIRCALRYLGRLERETGSETRAYCVYHLGPRACRGIAE